MLLYTVIYRDSLHFKGNGYETINYLVITNLIKIIMNVINNLSIRIGDIVITMTTEETIHEKNVVETTILGY